MSPARKTQKPIKSVEELLAHALAMETEAAERYAELADQMAVHNNKEMAALFQKLAEIEQQHVHHVSDLSKGAELPRIPPWEYRWPGASSPEAIDADDVHYLTRPYQAIELALRHERRGAEFYADLARGAKRVDVRELAARLAAEEEEHVHWLEQWLARYPKPEGDWDEDPDPPNIPE